MIKKVQAILIAFLLLFVSITTFYIPQSGLVVSVHADEGDPWEGDGTADNPWLLKSTLDFNKIRTTASSSNAYYKDKFFEVANDFEIYQSIPSFDGTLDGKGHTLTISAPLIQILSIHGMIKNLYLDGSITELLQEGSTVQDNCGAFCRQQNGTIMNCGNYANIDCTSNEYAVLQLTVGGISGRITDMGTGLMINCFNQGNIKGSLVAPAGGKICIGGLAGFNDKYIYNGYNTGTITTQGGSGNKKGSICGEDSGKVTNCYYKVNPVVGVVGYNSEIDCALHSDAEFKDGTVLAKLNQYVTDTGAAQGCRSWMGDNIYPVFDPFHSHGSWVYTVGEGEHTNELTATCGVAGCGTTPVSATVAISAVDKTFDGAKDEAVLEGTDDFNSTIGESVADSDIQYYQGSTLLDAAPKDAGTYVAKLSIGGKTAEKEFVISPKTLTDEMVSVKVADTSPINEISYTGELITPQISVSDIVGGSELITTSDYELSGQYGAIKDVGDYTVVVTGKGNYEGSVNAEWKILGLSFDDGDITITSYDDVYDGAAHGIFALFPAGAFISYCDTEDGTYQTEAITYKDYTDGAKTVYYKISKDGYNDAKGFGTVNIGKSPLTVVPDDNQSKEYGDSDSTLTYSIDPTNGLKGDDTSAVLSGALTYSGSDVGDYPISGSFMATNYDVTVDAGHSFKITPKSLADAVVTLEKTQTPYTGASITNSVVSVTLGGVTIPATGYDVSGDLSQTDCNQYTVTITGKGNYKDSAQATWSIVDTIPPTGDIKIGTDSIMKAINTATFGLFFKNTQTVTIEADDAESGVDKVYYYLSDSNLDALAVKSITGWMEYSDAFHISPEAKRIVYAMITDVAGNKTYIGSDGLVLDGTPPLISEIKDGKVYCQKKTMRVADDNLDTVTVNGDSITLDDDSYELEASNATYEIVATDLAGNETHYTVTVNDGHTWGPYVDNHNATVDKNGTKTAKCRYCSAKDVKEIPNSKIKKPANDPAKNPAKDLMNGSKNPSANQHADSAKSDVSNKKTAKRKSPKTGDDANLFLWEMCMLGGLAGAAICFMQFKKRRNK